MRLESGPWSVTQVHMLHTPHNTVLLVVQQLCPFRMTTCATFQTCVQLHSSLHKDVTTHSLDVASKTRVMASFHHNCWSKAAGKSALCQTSWNCTPTLSCAEQQHTEPTAPIMSGLYYKGDTSKAVPGTYRYINCWKTCVAPITPLCKA